MLLMLGVPPEMAVACHRPSGVSMEQQGTILKVALRNTRRCLLGACCLKKARPIGCADAVAVTVRGGQWDYRDVDFLNSPHGEVLRSSPCASRPDKGRAVRQRPCPYRK